MENNKINNLILMIVLALVFVLLIVISAISLNQLKEKDRIINNLQSEIISLKEENRDIMDLYTKEVLEKDE